MKQSKTPIKNRFGIRWSLFAYMLLFLFLLLGLLWLFQVVFFGEIYKTVRTNEIKNSADHLSEYVDLSNSEIRDAAEQISSARQVCILVFDEAGNVIASADTLSDCLIHGMTARNIYMLKSRAKDSGGEDLSRFRLDAFSVPRPSIGTQSPDAAQKEAEDNSAESIIYTKIVYSESRGTDIVVMLNTTISPVASTIRTLQTELIIISAVMILLAVLLSLILAKRISAPIVRINSSAKELAKGNYDADFSVSGYREAAELSGTLSYAAEELSKAGSLQRELISNISHDLRTPLTMITGYAEVMRDLPGENTPENVQIIIDEANRLSSLVNDVLDISKLQSGTQALEISEFDLTETIKEVIGRFSKFTEKEGRTIEFIHEHVVMVTADRTRILQVIYNFINNALTHSDADKPVQITQKITQRDGRNAVHIEVTDFGEGIAPEEIPNIWDRYYKVDKPHRRAASGSGLGLSIVKSILELHGARYGVESELRKGSTFWFEL